MKCPKCGFISFDHNESCPKCNKDISAERTNLNVLLFKPSVPFLLGSLTGEGGDVDIDIDIAAARVKPGTDVYQEIDIEEEMSSALEDTEDISPLEKDDLFLADMEKESLVVEPSPGIEEDLEPKFVHEASLPQDNEFSFDFDDFVTESGTVDQDLAAEESVLGTDDELALDLDEFSLDDGELVGGITAVEASPMEKETSFAFGETDDLTEEILIPVEEEEILSLDDLKINDTGELEIEPPPMRSATEKTGASYPEIKIDEETIDISDFELYEEKTIVEGLSGDGNIPKPKDPTADVGGLSLDDDSSSLLEKHDYDEFMIDMDDLELELDLDLEGEEPDKNS